MPHLENDFHKSFMQNRELSWLCFNRRVLEEAEDDSVPLYERLKFISIFTSNLDEFFMIRVGSLTDLLYVENNVDDKTGLTAGEQLELIFRAAVPLYKERDRVFGIVEEKLREFGIRNLDSKELKKNEKKQIDKIFEEEIMPILSAQVIDSRHPFPHLANKNIYIVCEFAGETTKFGLVHISQSLPGFFMLSGTENGYILTEKIVLEHISDVFGMYKIECAAVISVTRNADISPEDEIFEVDDDFRERMKKVIKKRSRLSPVRLEVQGHLSKDLSNFLLSKLHLTKEQVFISGAPLVMAYVFDLHSHIAASLIKQLSYPEFKPRYSSNLNSHESITVQCKKKDILLFFPYDQMEPFLQLLRESAQDPAVISIKITIYRLSRNSRIIDYLCDAAENNKEVTVLMELKARFDEKNNIEWAERLEDAGCTVIYGFEGFKVHSKICLITRRDRNKVFYITQVGTGNYNEKTAKLYSDLSLITASQELGQEANEFFKNMSIANLQGNYNNLFVAPYFFKSNIIALIDYEIDKARRGVETCIIMKSNSLTDRDIMNKLSEASQAGVEIKLIIRGICCLLPGIEGRTENITVYSIVGRFLEHSRVYSFGKGKDARLYISSADMMTRNTRRRVEIACPIVDEDIRERLYHILDVMLSDTVKARKLDVSGSYCKPEADTIPLDAQQSFIEEAMREEGRKTASREYLLNFLKRIVRTTK